LHISTSEKTRQMFRSIQITLMTSFVLGRLQRKRYRVLSKVVSFPLSGSDVQYALKCKQFTTLSKLFEITMNPAWDRLCREQAHAI